MPVFEMNDKILHIGMVNPAPIPTAPERGLNTHTCTHGCCTLIALEEEGRRRNKKKNKKKTVRSEKRKKRKKKKKRRGEGGHVAPSLFSFGAKKPFLVIFSFLRLPLFRASGE